MDGPSLAELAKVAEPLSDNLLLKTLANYDCSLNQ
jgi:hypothetical protein